MCGVLFLDLKKAFDSVNHRILLSKLQGTGLTRKGVRWFESYLLNRCQVTKVNGETSERMRVRYGVPQGSILGPLLFVIYINDLPTHLRNCRVHLYADDTAVSVSGTSTDELNTKLNDKLEEVARWMNTNRLTLNVKKTNIMTFGTTHTLNKLGELNVTNSGETVSVVEQTKYLGVILDRKLNFSDHVQYIKKKCIGRIKMLTKLRPIVGEQISLDLYKSLMIPLLDYADVVYDTLSAKDNAILQRMQNCALKVVLQTEWRTPTKEIHKRLKMNLVADRRHIHTATQVYKSLHELAPAKIGDMFVEVGEVRNDNTRTTRAMTRRDLAIPDVKLKVSQGAFKYRGAILYNLVDEDIRAKETLNQFKQAINKSDMFAIV